MTFTDLPSFLKHPQQAAPTVSGRSGSRSSTPTPGNTTNPSASSRDPDHGELSDSDIQGLAFPTSKKPPSKETSVPFNDGSNVPSAGTSKDDSTKHSDIDPNDDASRRPEDVPTDDDVDEVLAKTSEDPSSLLQQPRRLELFFGAEFLPTSKTEFDFLLDRVAQVDMVDWCDSFSAPFHVSLACDSSMWQRLCDSFDRLSTPEDLNIWLSSKIKSNSLAFLSANRANRPLLFHTLCSPEDCGTFTNPKLTFYALDRIPFESPPFEILLDDMSEMIRSLMHRNVPTFSEIIAHCVVDSELPSDGDLPRQFFDPEKLKTLLPASPSKYDQDHSFSCSGLCILPPALAGFILQNCCDPSDEQELTCGLMASFLYKTALYHWWSFRDSLSSSEKKNGPPLDHPLLKVQGSMFRFLWLIEHKSSSVPVTHPSVPKDLAAASYCLQHCLDLIVPPPLSESPTPKRSNTSTKTSSSSAAPTAPLKKPSAKPPPIPQTQSTLPPSTPVDCHANPSGVRMMDDDGNVHFVSPEMFLLSKCIKEVSSKKASNDDDITSPESKSMFRDMPLHAQKHLRLSIVNRSSKSLPDELSDIVKLVWKSKNSSTFFESFVSEVFDPSDNACTILLGQCAVIQRLGLRWRSEASPGGFSPFSFDPYAIPGIDSSHTLDKNIRQQIHDASLCHLNDMKQSKDMQLLYTNHSLFFPRTEDEFEKQLRSFWSCAKGLCGSSSFIASQILKVLNFFHLHRYLIIAKMQSSANEFFFGQILFALDKAVQEFVSSLSKA